MDAESVMWLMLVEDELEVNVCGKGQKDRGVGKGGWLGFTHAPLPRTQPAPAGKAVRSAGAPSQEDWLLPVISAPLSVLLP